MCQTTSSSGTVSQTNCAWARQHKQHITSCSGAMLLLQHVFFWRKNGLQTYGTCLSIQGGGCTSSGTVNRSFHWPRALHLPMTNTTKKSTLVLPPLTSRVASLRVKKKCKYFNRVNLSRKVNNITFLLGLFVFFLSLLLSWTFYFGSIVISLVSINTYL